MSLDVRRPKSYLEEPNLHLIYRERKGPFGIYLARDVYLELKEGEISAIVDVVFGNIEEGNLLGRVLKNAFFGLLRLESGRADTPIQNEKLRKGEGLEAHLKSVFCVPEEAYHQNVEPLLAKYKL